MIDPTKDEQENANLEQKLQSFDLSYRSQVRDMLKRRLVQSIPARQKSHRGAMKMNARNVKLGFALPVTLIALLLVLALTVPGVQAMAQDLLRQIGQFVLVDRSVEEPSIPVEGQLPVETQPTVEAPAFSPITPVDLAEASKLAGFTAMETAALPDGYVMVERTVNALPDGIGVYTVYQKGGMEALLTIAQARYEPGSPAQELWVGGTKISDVSVRGQTGSWIEGITMGIPVEPNGRAKLVKMNALVWEEEGFTFLVTTNTLPLEAVLSAAEGLK